MPYEIDKDKIESPDMKMLDISSPPLKQVPHQEYPKMVYLHPRDKSKEHRTKIVGSSAEESAAASQGWKTQPHIPVAPPEDLSADFEAPAAEEQIEPAKRGPGRPASNKAKEHHHAESE